MISINFTGNTLDDVVRDAGAFVARWFVVPFAAEQGPAEPVDPLPLAGQPPIETGGHDLVPSVETVEAAKRKRRTKAEMEAARAAAPSALDALAEATAAGPAPAAEPVAPATVEDVKAALMKVVEKEGAGPAAGSKVLADHGVTRVSLLKEDQFAAVIASCQAVAP